MLIKDSQAFLWTPPSGGLIKSSKRLVSLLELLFWDKPSQSLFSIGFKRWPVLESPVFQKSIAIGWCFLTQNNVCGWQCSAPPQAHLPLCLSFSFFYAPLAVWHSYPRPQFPHLQSGHRRVPHGKACFKDEVSESVSGCRDGCLVRGPRLCCNRHFWRSWFLLSTSVLQYPSVTDRETGPTPWGRLAGLHGNPKQFANKLPLSRVRTGAGSQLLFAVAPWLSLWTLTKTHCH